MLHMPVSEEDRELLEKLKKMADSIEPPASLSPEQIKNRLPDRKIIPFSRRIAPYAAAAACLAVVLTGTTLFLKNQETASDGITMETVTQSASAADDASSEAAAAEADMAPEENNAIGKENTVLYSAEAQEDAAAEQSADSYETVYEAITGSAADSAVQDKRGMNVTSAAMSAPSAAVDGTEYCLSGVQQLKAVSADGTSQTVELALPEGWSIEYLTEAGGCLGVMGQISGADQTFAVCYDVSEPLEPVETVSIVQSGTLEGVWVSSDGTLLLLSRWTPSDPGDGSDPSAFIPAVDTGSGAELLLPEEILLGKGSGYLVATAIDPGTGTVVGRIACCGVSGEDGFTGDGFQWNGSLFRWENGSFVKTDN